MITNAVWISELTSSLGALLSEMPVIGWLHDVVSDSDLHALQDMERAYQQDLHVNMMLDSKKYSDKAYK